jgi:hypothetical protein
MMVIDNKFEIGQTVYLKTDTEQLMRIITGLTVRATSIVYELSIGERTSNHFDFEISEEENIQIKCK